MDSNEFRRAGDMLVEYCAKYMDTIRDRECLPKIKPGYLAKIMPMEAPEQPEKWEDIMKDFEPYIMDGMTHWQHPSFHAYFSNAPAWISIISAILINGTGVQMSTHSMCPAATELEMIVLDWCCKLFSLPDFFLTKMSNPDSIGGGAIQASASESIYMSILCARERGIRKLQVLYGCEKPRAVLLKMLRGYGSSTSHSSVDKGAMMADVNLKFLDPGAKGHVLAVSLIAAIEEDRKKGFYPHFYSAILGSTSICAFDDIDEIGPVCTVNDMWLHVDGAYAGSSFCLPELHYLKTGLEHAWSFNTNCNKWFLTNFDCSLHWFRYAKEMTDFTTGYDPTFHNKSIPDYRNWGIPYGRRFRSVKLWMVIRNNGAEGIRAHKRNQIRLAKLFEKYVHRDPRFEVIGETRVGLCCFRLLGPNELTEQLLELINDSRRNHMVPALHDGKFLIRYAICAIDTQDSDIEYSWDVISEFAIQVVQKYQETHTDLEPVKHLIKGQIQYLAAQETRQKSKQLLELAALAEKEIAKTQTAIEDDYLIRSTSKLDKFFEDEVDEDDTWKAGSKIHAKGNTAPTENLEKTQSEKSMQQSMCIIS